jgi:hypothetical protein
MPSLCSVRRSLAIHSVTQFSRPSASRPPVRPSVRSTEHLVRSNPSLQRVQIIESRAPPPCGCCRWRITRRCCLIEGFCVGPAFPTPRGLAGIRRCPPIGVCAISDPGKCIRRNVSSPYHGRHRRVQQLFFLYIKIGHEHGPSPRPTSPTRHIEAFVNRPRSCTGRANRAAPPRQPDILESHRFADDG